MNVLLGKKDGRVDGKNEGRNEGFLDGGSLIAIVGKFDGI